MTIIRHPSFINLHFLFDIPVFVSGFRCQGSGISPGKAGRNKVEILNYQKTKQVFFDFTLVH